jgi:hypothetical protein
VRHALALLSFLAIAGAGRSALADAASCSKDAEDGQRARASGHLREARERFAACSATDCPAVVQKDCATWASEVLTATPTIVVDAKDANGGDIADVVVSLDETVVASRIDGKAIAIDPGPHTLKFEHKGFQPVTQSIIAKEGMKARVVTVTFAERTGPPPPRLGLVSSKPNGSGGHTVFPWIVVGAGLIGTSLGVALFLSAPDFPEGQSCDKQTRTCSPLPGETEQSAPFKDRQERAGQSEAYPLAGGVLIAISGVFIVGGLLWHFLEGSDPPPSSTKLRPKLAPWMGRSAGGMALSGTF